MDDKKAHEAYRVQQFSGPHPALHAASAAATQLGADQGAAAAHSQYFSSLGSRGSAQLSADPKGSSVSFDPLGVQLVPDQYRVIVHFDVDAFYSQVEEVRNPVLRGRPLAVTQKYLVVTCNYPARQAGVTKLMNISEARKKCPGLVMVPGEDLTPYRAASRDIRAVLSRWGPTEKLGLDESWVDITQEVNSRVSSSSISSIPPLNTWPCPLATAEVQITADSRHRPQDIRAAAAVGGVTAAVTPAVEVNQPPHPAAQPGAQAAASIADGGVSCDVWRMRLYHGCLIAAEMKAAVMRETQYRCSAGVAFNKLLSKLVSGLHKPNGQTAITPDHAADFIAPLPARALPGVGYRTDAVLKTWGVVTAGDIRGISKQQLVETLGAKTGGWLYGACRGVDSTAVVASGPPKTISVEDSFKSCSTWDGVKKVLQVLVPDLLDRVHEDVCEFGAHRKPASLTVKWRRAGTGWHRSSASTQWPVNNIVNNSHNNTQNNSHNNGTVHAAAAAAAVGTASLWLLHPSQSLLNPSSVVNPDHVELVTAAALKVLKQQLQGSFCLTLLNIGVTGFKESAAAAGSGIHHYFRSAAAAGAGGSSSSGMPDNPTSTAAAGVGGGGVSNSVVLDTLHLSRTSTAARRDYDSYSRQQQQVTSPAGQPPAAAVAGGGRSVVLTKRQERMMLEQGQQQQQQSVCEQQQQWVSAPQHLEFQQQQQGTSAYSQKTAVVATPLSCDFPPSKRARTQPAQQRQQQQQQASAEDAPHQSTNGPSTDQHPSIPQQQQQQQCSMSQEPVTVPQHSDQPATSLPALTAVGSSGQFNIHQLGEWGVVSCELVEGYDDEDNDHDHEIHSEGSGWMLAEDDCEVCIHTAEEQWEVGQLQDGTLPASLQQGRCDLGLQQQQQQLQTTTLHGVSDGHCEHPAVLGDDKDDEDVMPIDPCNHSHRHNLRDHDGDDDEDHEWSPCAPGQQQQQHQSRAQCEQQQHKQPTPQPQQQQASGHGAAATVSNPTNTSGGSGRSRITSSSCGPDPQRVVIHVDCDCYYCVEVLDRPDLRGRPLAVTQFNAGGFVAVSYEARAAGVRCGDGVGERGRAVIQHLRDMGAVSVNEAKRRCPGLVVVPMRPARYREVADQLHHLLRAFAPDGQVEKASYDDYYLDVTAACGEQQQRQQQMAVTADMLSAANISPERIHIVTMAQQQQQEQQAASSSALQQQQLPANWHQLEPHLQQGLVIALNLKAAVYKTLGLTVSCGVASGKLLARLVGPLHKPNSITALPLKHALAWIRTRDLRTIPQLQQQTGAAVVKGLGSSSVGHLQGLELRDLQQRFGSVTGNLLYHVYAAGSGGGGCGSPVRERGPVKQLVVGRSCQPLNSLSSVRSALGPLVADLWQRVQRDAADHQRLPVRLSLTWRHGYSKQQTRTAHMSQQLKKHMQQMVTMSGKQAAAAAGMLVEASKSGYGDVGAGGMQLMTGEQGGGLGSRSDAGLKAAVCKMLEDAYLDILTTAIRGAGSGSGSKSRSGVRGMKGQTQLVVGLTQSGSSVPTAGGIIAAGSGAHLNITRLSLGVMYGER